VQKYTWDEMEKEAMGDLMSRRFVSGEKLTVAQVAFQKGGSAAVHQHESEQISYVLEGTLRFHVAGEEVIMTKGQVLLLPSNVPHGAEALEDAVVLDVFSPIRRDWIK
jgi:quercetin dioxygenase-like cupin family protein